jgi:DNA-binding MarR family transcriptional regulator
MSEKHIHGVRNFSRFYTNVIGLLDKHLLDSEFSLPEARILYELGNHQPCTASDLMALVNMDRGYMSRILSNFVRKKLIQRKKSATDGRSYFLTLTAKGNNAFHTLDSASHQQVETLLAPMDEASREKLLHHMNEITVLLSTPTK